MSGRIGNDAFEFYVSLGPSRSYQAVADRYGVGKRAVTKRAAREEWTERLANIEREARERSDKRLVDTIDDMRGRHLTTLKAIHSRALTALKQYPLNSAAEAMRAAQMVIKLERLIVGDPSDRTAITVEETTKRELERWAIPVEADEDEDDVDDN